MKINIKRNLYRLVSIVVFGSGLVNILSAAEQPVLSRQTVLLNVFPLEFLEFSNFLTVVLGIALAVSAINLFRRKTKAYYFALALSIASFVFHLTKGLDITEAVFSAVTAFLLVLTRKTYTVKSEKFNVFWVVSKVTVALLFVFLYGIIGFWLFDKKAFGVNFTLSDSFRMSFWQLTFATGHQLAARTRYARHFLESFRLASTLVLSYIFASFFIPIVFRSKKSVEDEDTAKKLVEKYGRSSLDYFKVWPDKSYFFTSKRDAFVSYGVGFNTAISLGDPVGERTGIESAIKGFVFYCEENGWRCAFHQALPDYLAIYKKYGLKSFKVGDQAIVDLCRFSLQGSSAKRFRYVAGRFEKDKYRARLVEPPLTDELARKLEGVSDSWLRIEGKRETAFTLGRFEKGYIASCPNLVVYDPGERPIAFANLVPAYARGGAAVDLMRHIREAPNGTMDYLFIKLFLLLKERGYSRFSLGLAPLSGFNIGEESSMVEKAVHQFAQNVNFLFNIKGLKQYKAKFAHIWEPRYLIYKRVTDLPTIARALNKLIFFS